MNKSLGIVFWISLIVGELTLSGCAFNKGIRRNCLDANDGEVLGECLICRSSNILIPCIKLIGAELLDDAIARIANVADEDVRIVFDEELSDRRVSGFDAENITLLEALSLFCRSNGLILLTDGMDTFYVLERGAFTFETPCNKSAQYPLLIPSHGHASVPKKIKKCLEKKLKWE